MTDPDMERAEDLFRQRHGPNAVPPSRMKARMTDAERIDRLEQGLTRLAALYQDALARLTVAEGKLEAFRQNGQTLTWRLTVLEAQSMPSNPSRYQMAVMVRKRLEALGLPEASQLLLQMMDRAVRAGDRELMLAFNEPVPGLADQEMLDDMLFQRVLEQYPPGMPGTREFWSREENISLARRVNAKRRELQAQGVPTLPPFEERDLRLPPTEAALRSMSLADQIRLAMPAIEEATRGEGTGQQADQQAGS